MQKDTENMAQSQENSEEKPSMRNPYGHEIAYRFSQSWRTPQTENSVVGGARRLPHARGLNSMTCSPALPAGVVTHCFSLTR